jgi:predicted PolB exonuclease-like 3'-5' exonuclease
MFLVFDIETVPDVALARRWLGLDPSLDPEQVVDRLAAAHPHLSVPKPLFHQIVAVALALVGDDGTIRWIGPLGEPEEGEATLVQRFFAAVARHHPRLVGWNSGGFDLPCLVYRAIHHGIRAPDFYARRGYRYRYDEDWHLDLMDLLAGYGATPRVALDEMAALVGVPGKVGMTGADVWPLFLQGERDRIRAYCTADVLTTTLIFGAYAYHRGWWDAAHRERLVASARAFLEAHRDDPIWTAYRAAWEASAADDAS